MMHGQKNIKSLGAWVGSKAGFRRFKNRTMISRSSSPSYCLKDHTEMTKFQNGMKYPHPSLSRGRTSRFRKIAVSSQKQEYIIRTLQGIRA